VILYLYLEKNLKINFFNVLTRRACSSLLLLANGIQCVKVEVIAIVWSDVTLTASSMYGHDVKRWSEQFIMRPSLINDNNQNQNKNLSLH